MSDRDKIEYWRNWNVPRHPGINEGAGDQSARELAQIAHALRLQLSRATDEIAALQKEVARLKDQWICSDGEGGG